MDFRLPKKELAKVKEFSILDLDKITYKGKSLRNNKRQIIQNFGDNKMIAK